MEVTDLSALFYNLYIITYKYKYKYEYLKKLYIYICI